jgi:hypothetical protein
MTGKPRSEAYVYVLIDPRDRLPFYVGKGTGMRWAQHLKDFKAGLRINAMKTAWIAEILAAGMEPHHEIIFDQLSDFEALTIEARLITEYRAILTNKYNSIPKWADEWAKARAIARRILDRVVYLYENQNDPHAWCLPSLFKSGFIRHLTKFAYPDV